MSPNNAREQAVTPVGQDEDAALAIRASKGESAAFGLLYDRHVAAIYRYVYYRVRDDAEAEDLTSDVFMRALKAMPRYEPRQALSPGNDGLSFTRTLIEDAAPLLCGGGWLMVELGAGQAEQARALLSSDLWEDVTVRPDLQGIPRLLVARRGSMSLRSSAGHPA